jgi:hypothetical protein
MEQFMEEYGGVTIAVLAGILLIGIVICLAGEDGSLYQYVVNHCSRAV